VTLADWLGSNASAFDAEAVTTDPVDATTQTVKGYLSISRERAHDAVATMGAASSPVVHSSFQTLYPEYESPRPIQRRALQRSHTGKPSLTIIEAPTGEGKTEAALLQAARQQKGRGEGGIYVAMPTQATSNSIFGRIAGFVKRATGRAEIDDLALVHGGADLHPSRRSSDEGDDTEEIYDEDGPDVGQVRTRAWFLPKKRGLLSPYGIGTVDQAFLGTLHVRHFFLRLFGLAGKTVIFDEVHAYDTYMARIFEQLLRWLKAVDAHVILLSATLPGSLRDQFLEAWDAEPTVTGRDAPYPAMWHTDGGLCAPNEGNEDDDLSVDPANRRSITVRPHGMSRGAIAATVNRALDAGATVAVLCNTVARAQNVYSHLTQSGQSASQLDDHDRWLLHARLIHKERATRETAVNERFGSSRASGRSALLVATQVAEQSLDIDVDLMLTDLAPIDLLLQRAGRLQRHQDEHRGERPQGYDEAMLHVMMPRVSADRLPNLKETPLGYETVYMPAPMLRTWNELRNGTVWTLPDDYREVVESVYGDDADPPVRLQKEDRQRWREAMMERKDSERDDRRTAVSRLISRPSQLYNLFQVDEPERIEDDDPSVHRSLRAPTRLTDLPSIGTVVLHQQEEDESYYLDRTCEREAPICDLDAMENRRLLQEHTVRVTHSTIPDLLNDVADEHAALLKQFEETPAFRYHRPLVFTDGVWERDGARMRFDDRLGLVIEAHGS
jgi:CRISPR-associated endonuclease/helicase Cas3